MNKVIIKVLVGLFFINSAIAGTIINRKTGEELTFELREETNSVRVSDQNYRDHSREGYREIKLQNINLKDAKAEISHPIEYDYRRVLPAATTTLTFSDGVCDTGSPTDLSGLTTGGKILRVLGLGVYSIVIGSLSFATDIVSLPVRIALRPINKRKVKKDLRLISRVINEDIDIKVSKKRFNRIRTILLYEGAKF